MATILEALENAEYNLVGNKFPNPISKAIGGQQLNNAIILLEKGYGPHFEMDDLLNEYDNLEDAPDND